MTACYGTTDASCAPCPSLGSNHAYTTAGSCDTACTEGFFDAGTQGCVPCAAVMCTQPGQMRSTDCVALADRQQAPTCVACPAAPAGGAFVTGCTWGCYSGYIAQGGGCVACNATLLCNWGTELSCYGGGFECSPCATGLAVLSSAAYDFFMATTNAQCRAGTGCWSRIGSMWPKAVAKASAPQARRSPTAPPSCRSRRLHPLPTRRPTPHCRRAPQGAASTARYATAFLRPHDSVSSVY